MGSTPTTTSPLHEAASISTSPSRFSILVNIWPHLPFLFPAVHLKNSACLSASPILQNHQDEPGASYGPKTHHQPSTRGAESTQLAKCSGWLAGDPAWDQTGWEVTVMECVLQAPPENEFQFGKEAQGRRPEDEKNGGGKINREKWEEHAESPLDPGLVWLVKNMPIPNSGNIHYLFFLMKYSFFFLS